MEYRRWRDDKRVNYAPCLIVSALDQVENFKHTSTQSHDLQVGDIIMLKEDD